jgi:hypothetical protein
MRTLIALAALAAAISPALSAPKQQPQFDPPACVSGADTYCQPIGSSPPPVLLPPNVPR